MKRLSPNFDGKPFFTEDNWVGAVLRGGFGFEMPWLIDILKTLVSKQFGFVCMRVVLPNHTEYEWRDTDHPLDLIEFNSTTVVSDLTDWSKWGPAMGPYYNNFRFASHYFEALDGSWRMHLPCDEQAERCEYKIWAGTPEVWLKLRPYFEPLPRYEPAQSGPLSQAYARDYVYLTDDPELPRNVVAGLGPVKFAADAGYGWLTQ